MSDERKKLWEPSNKWIKNAEATHFIEFINKEYNLSIRGGRDLYKWSVEKIPDFWEAMWKFSGIIASKPYDKV
ncbi:MAG: acetoacetate--CoA ligase, partial [Promethearchaeota archaeon]